jgi:hypothetical protein
MKLEHGSWRFSKTLPAFKIKPPFAGHSALVTAMIDSSLELVAHRSLRSNSTE